MTEDLKAAAGLAKAISHPLRIQILREVEAAPLSPVGFSKKVGLAINNVSYHFTELTKAGCLELVDTAQRRGALEHIYASTARGRKLLALVEGL